MTTQIQLHTAPAQALTARLHYVPEDLTAAVQSPNPAQGTYHQQIQDVKSDITSHVDQTSARESEAAHNSKAWMDGIQNQDGIGSEAIKNSMGNVQQAGIGAATLGTDGTTIGVDSAVSAPADIQGWARGAAAASSLTGSPLGQAAHAVSTAGTAPATAVGLESAGGQFVNGLNNIATFKDNAFSLMETLNQNPITDLWSRFTELVGFAGDGTTTLDSLAALGGGDGGEAGAGVGDVGSVGGAGSDSGDGEVGINGGNSGDQVVGIDSPSDHGPQGIGTGDSSPSVRQPAPVSNSIPSTTPSPVTHQTPEPSPVTGAGDQGPTEPASAPNVGHDAIVWH